MIAYRVVTFNTVLNKVEENYFLEEEKAIECHKKADGEHPRSPNYYYEIEITE